MDSPPERAPPLAREPPLSSPSMPSLDHSPQALHPTSSEPSPPGSPSCPLSGAEEERSTPPSPTPAVALLAGQLERGGPSSESLGALERAISSGQSSCSDELDLQLFNSDAPGRSGLRFPCTVCGKRFRFQSILSLHARAHSLERRPPHTSRPSHALQKDHVEDPQSLHTPRFIFEASTALTPPLLEEAPSATSFSPLPATPAFRCHACKGKFRTASELARHVRILHNPYKCTMCPFSASQEESLAAHLQQSHPPDDSASAAAPPLETPPTAPAFRCETCGQRFTQSWFLKGHMRKHKDSLDHKCQVCGRGFKEPWFLKNHMKVHLNKLGLKADPGKSPASSQVLGALYSNLLLARSMAGGAGSGGQTDPSKSSILSYLGLPKDASNGSCVERLQAVAQVAEMGSGRAGEGADVWQLVARSLVAAQHQQPRPLPHHQAPPSRVRPALEAEASSWECPDCGKTFRSLQQVVAHARVHVHKTQKGPAELLSRVSGGGAGEPRAGPDHEGRQEAKQISSGGRASGSLNSVISHLSGQNGLRAQSASSSPRERVRGTGMKDCPYCGKAFRSSHHLKVHLRVHTGERPYKCPHCDYAGTQSGSLKYHLQRHHREQRNAMASSPSSPSPGLLSSTGSSRDGVKKQRRLPSLSQSLVRASGEPQHNQPWMAGPSDKSGSSGSQRQREANSGMMGTLFPAGQDAGWIGEAPFPKVPKVSRRKPLTTSRMVSANGCQDGTSSSGEPLDLSRRPSLEESFAEGGQARDVLNQCVFCPFRTSSVELMAMHIQVNHTSKSRRKRGGSSKRSASDPVSLWKFLGVEEGRASPDYWTSSGSNVENGVSPEAERDLSPPPLGGFTAPEKIEDLDEDEDLDAMDDDQSVSPDLAADEPLKEEQAIFGN